MVSDSLATHSAAALIVSQYGGVIPDTILPLRYLFLLLPADLAVPHYGGFPDTIPSLIASHVLYRHCIESIECIRM
jgi:hypothetical protein